MENNCRSFFLEDLKRKSKIIYLEQSTSFKNKLLLWAHQFDVFVWLDNNDYHQKYSSYDAVLAVGVNTSIHCDCRDAFDKLKEFQSGINDYIFGYLGYDLKNDLEDLTSNNNDGIDFSDLYFFQPKKIFCLKENTLEVKYLNKFKKYFKSHSSR